LERKLDLDIFKWKKAEDIYKKNLKVLRKEKKWILEKGTGLAFRSLKDTKDFHDKLYALTARADAMERKEGMMDA
jgi:hypothetical protein